MVGQPGKELVQKLDVYLSRSMKMFKTYLFILNIVRISLTGWGKILHSYSMCVIYKSLFVNHWKILYQLPPFFWRWGRRRWQRGWGLWQTQLQRSWNRNLGRKLPISVPLIENCPSLPWSRSLLQMFFFYDVLFICHCCHCDHLMWQSVTKEEIMWSLRKAAKKERPF